MRSSIIFVLVLCPFVLIAQNNFVWTELSPMPEPVSNNAVSQGFAGDTLCVYSFCGISSGLEPTDIHLKSWRFNTILNEWQTIEDVDDTQGKIAAGASTVNNVIYLMGGYKVNSNFSEVTSEKVHRFDCESNEWLSEGTPMPVPVDDHVQAVWRDSLIFIVSGWSNTTNVNNVQIYNPYLDSWESGTATPDNNDYEAFGASGTIIGDTIYYFGGTQINSFSFTANRKFRKGVINPDNPTEIEWELLPEAPGDNGYRMAALNYQQEAIWMGGAPIAYNFDGLAYANNQGVEPLETIRLYRTNSQSWETYVASDHPVMDLRGIAQLNESTWVIAGGMAPNQQVSNKVYSIMRGNAVGVENIDALYYTLSQDGATFTVDFMEDLKGQLSVYSSTGNLVNQSIINGPSSSFDLTHHAGGMYIVSILSEKELMLNFKVFKP
jgi:hypothetical protein